MVSLPLLACAIWKMFELNVRLGLPVMVDPALQNANCEAVPEPPTAPAAQEFHVAVVPFDTRHKPLVPTAKRVAELVPLPTIRSPVDVIGDSALNAADAVVWPEP